MPHRRGSVPDSPWAFRTVEQDCWYRWRLDGAEVFLRNSGNDWFWATQPKHPEGLRRNFGGPEIAPPPPHLEIRRTIAKGQPVALRPFALSRPFVVWATTVISILPGEEVEFSADLPVSVRWMTASGEVLAHPNTIELHKTWFGDTANGRLCFLWPSTLEPPSEKPYGSMIRCRIVVRNNSKTNLMLKQFPIYCEYLSLWEVDSGLRSDLVLVEGLNDQSLRMSTIVFEGTGTDTLLYEATTSHTELFFQRGVEFLRNLAGIS